MQFENLSEQLFYQALRVRLVEEKIIELYPTDKIQSPVHLSIGQEAVAVGVCNNLTKDDQLYSSYRSHAYYLAKGGNLPKMFAELYGKATGCGKGKAGSMHLSEKSVGMMGSSAIVASTISHAVGSAMASKYFNKGQVAVATFGDGASEEGSYHESLNFASAFNLPVIFLCENNGLAIHSKLEHRHLYDIKEHASAYKIPSIKIKQGWDFELIDKELKRIVKQVKETCTPFVVEVITYRYKEHVGISDDHHVPYRSSADFQNWKKNDPLMNNQKLVDKFSSEINKEIELAVKFAEESPFPKESELLKDVY